jgi:hypothetical protein
VSEDTQRSSERNCLIISILLTGEQNFGFAGIDFPMSNNQGSGPVIVDVETRDFWNTSRMLANDSRRNASVTEMPPMHIFQNTKRQNCGLIPRHHNPFFASSTQGGSGSNVMNSECEGNVNQQASTSSGFYGVRNHLGRMPDFRQFPSGSLEAGNINEGSFRETYQNTIFPGYEERVPYHPVHGSMVGNDHPHLGRMPCKRKSSMLDSSTNYLDLRASGIWNNDVRFTEASGSRGSTGSVTFPDCTPVLPELLNARGSDGFYQFDRMNSLHYQQGNRNCDRNVFAAREIHQASVPGSRAALTSYPSQLWMSRRLSGIENTSESNGYTDASPIESSVLSQNIGGAADTFWGGNSTFMEQASNNTGFNVTPRDLNSGCGIGNYARHYVGGSANQHGISPGESILQYAVEPSNRTTLNLSRTLPVRDVGVSAPHFPANHYVHQGPGPLRASGYTLGASSNRRSNGNMLPFPSSSAPCATPSSNSQRSQVTYRDAYPSFPPVQGPLMTSIFPASLDIGRPSPLSNLYRMQFRGLPDIPPERINRQHRFSQVTSCVGKIPT